MNRHRTKLKSIGMDKEFSFWLDKVKNPKFDDIMTGNEFVVTKGPFKGERGRIIDVPKGLENVDINQVLTTLEDDDGNKIWCTRSAFNQGYLRIL